MTATVHRFATRGEWLRARRIGSSDVPAILGVSPYRGPWDVLERLLGETEPDDRPNESQERGRRLEPVVLRRYARETGADVRPTPPHTLYTRDEWASATPDARAGELVVEAKTDRHRDRWGEPTTIERWTPEAAEIVRPDYYLQVAHQLWVLDAPAADLAVLVPGDDPFLPELRVYRLERDRELEARLVDRLRTWWQRHVVEGEPLPLDGSRAASRWLSRRERQGSRPATLAEVALAAQYETARQMEQAAKEARERAGQLLVAAAGEHARLDLPVGRVSIVRSEGRRTLDERALLEDHPELAPVLERYRRPGSPYTYARIDGLGGSR